MNRKIVIAIGGASGSIYAKLLVEKLAVLNLHDLHIDLIMTENAKINWKLEMSTFEESAIPYKIYANNDFFAPFASGSAGYDAMVLIPSSMGQIGRIANGISDDLITRAADVMLKERRTLILVPREAPYNLIQLRNMTSITEAGGIICPATPSFYSQPKSIDELAMTVVDRVLDLLRIEHRTYRWSTISVSYTHLTLPTSDLV